MNGSPEHDPVIVFRDVVKIYPLPAGDVVALDHVSITVEPGEFIAIMGPSGSGKSTLLNLMGCLDTPTSGYLEIKDRDIGSMNDDELTMLRRDHIGFIFQQFNLIPLLTALENVQYPLILKTGSRECTARCIDILRAMDLDPSLYTHKPAELSGGQQQRVAIARALVNDPDILLADEPTGNLDTKTGSAIMELLRELNEKRKKTIIMVTHDPNVARYAHRTIRIVDGRIT
ncbi:MAG TPA: ABC transporter ATP-binding protein [Methanolinea sp.]|nr:ABC transporter ATP-binding protein [Methanolinea sp.]HOS82355.1 ABC transporter ATP-binding protein [Methanolinea sp.]HPC55661.1 ABC transporter ATP-binding protein [Methanolinea sp.]HQE86025.1 ABC transporter ATP-binding protein [Methanolinea sp.]HQI14907.1 ABC transporter ATP-binding protein [Methanolinea sp.]